MAQERFWLDKNLPFVECRYSKNSGKHYKPHIHSTLSIGAIDNGEVLYRVNKEDSLLKPGSLAIINPNTLHQCNPLEKASRSYYMLYLDTRWCLRIQQSFCKTDSFIEPNEIIIKNQKLYKEYIECMDFLMRDEFLLEKEQAVSTLVEKIFKKLIDCQNKETQKIPLHVEAVKEMLTCSLDEDITLEDISKKLKINPYTLLRNFKDIVGITPHAYRMNYRIEYAKKLLQQQHQISQVALECGFYDQSHLNKHFKAITATTPREYQLNFIQ